MLSMGRNPGQYVVIGDNIIVQVIQSPNGDLRLAIDAPKDLSIKRGETYEQDNPTPECISRTRGSAPVSQTTSSHRTKSHTLSHAVRLP